MSMSLNYSTSTATSTITTPQHCLICYLEVPPMELEGGGGGGGVELTKSLISKDLHTIFVLRNLFEVPQERLVEYLVNSEGEGPSKWEVRLCPRCHVAVDNAKGIYQDVLRCSKNFKRARKEIVGVLRASEVRRRGHGPDIEVISNRILEETRTFACEHDYGHLTDPFKEGDLMADKVWSQNLAAQRLRESQASRKRRSRSRIKPYDPNPQQFGISMLHLCRDESGDRYQCPLCSQIFSHLSKMKFHVIRLHMDRLFASVQSPQVSDDHFKACCKYLLENLTPCCVTSTSESTLINSCSHCGKRFTDRRYLHCHWIQHHYDVLAVKLQNLQLNPDPILQPVTTGTPMTGSGGGVNQNKLLYTCSQCLLNFHDVGEMKVHIAVRHTEQYFPAAKFNPDRLPPERFKSCCALLFRGEKYKVVGNESFGCPFCEKTYTSKRFVYLHMLDSHYELMAVKLRKMLEQSGSTKPEVAATTASTSRTPATSTAISSLTCVDCGFTFASYPLLARHRQAICPVARRALGLMITDDDKLEDTAGGGGGGGTGSGDIYGSILSGLSSGEDSGNPVPGSSFMMDYSTGLEYPMDIGRVEVAPTQLLICKYDEEEEDDDVMIIEEDDHTGMSSMMTAPPQQYPPPPPPTAHVEGEGEEDPLAAIL